MLHILKIKANTICYKKERHIENQKNYRIKNFLILKIHINWNIFKKNFKELKIFDKIF